MRPAHLHQVVTAGAAVLGKGLEVPLHNELAYQRYTINVAVGTPPQSFSLMFDTGSTDVYLPLPNSSGCAPNCPRGFDPSTSTSIVDTHVVFNASYGLTPDLQIIGEYYNDTITVGTKTIDNAEFAVANVPIVFYSIGQWGIFGASSRLKETLYLTPSSPYFLNASATYTPLWERLSPSQAFSVWLNKQDAKTGQVVFDVTHPDHSKFEGDLKSVPINVRDDFVDWIVKLTSVTRIKSDGSKTTLTATNYSTSFVFDTGSPNMYIPSGLYNTIVEPLNPVMVNNTPYVLCSLRSSYDASLEFGFPTTETNVTATIHVPYNEIIYPFAYPVTADPVRDADGNEMCYFGAIPNDGPVRLLGATFIRSAYMIFDQRNLVVKMAQAKWRDY